MTDDASPTTAEMATAFRLREEWQKTAPSNGESASVLGQRINDDWRRRVPKAFIKGARADPRAVVAE